MRIEILDKGWVELIDTMPQDNCDQAIIEAARVSFLGESKGLEKDKKLLFYLYKNQHMTPFEMCEYKFRIKAPVLVWWQFVRHRTFSFNAQSGRYTPFEEDDFYVPEVWRLQSKDNKQGSDGFLKKDSKESIHLFDQLQNTYDFGYYMYNQALNYGVAKEQARIFLPAWASYYVWYAKIDLRNLLHFLKLRMDEHAQEEIRLYAQAISEFVKQKNPWTWEAFCTL